MDRKPVIADRRAIAVRVVGPFALVTVPAERLQGAEAEGIPVASVRRVVIGDRRRRDAVGLEAGSAQRLERELVAGAPSPTLEAVPGSPGEHLRRVGDRGGHRISRLFLGLRCQPRTLRQPGVGPT
jgi:hypothetical protein